MGCLLPCCVPHDGNSWYVVHSKAYVCGKGQQPNLQKETRYFGFKIKTLFPDDPYHLPTGRLLKSSFTIQGPVCFH